MTRTRTRPIVGAAAAAITLLVATAASGAPAAHATLQIRHQLHGCHAWAVDGGAFAPTQSLHLRRGASLTVRNNDVMPQTLVQTSGPAVTFTGKRTLGRVGAAVGVRFAKAGVYRFTTRAGEDYPWAKNMHTVGEDNVLRLTVTVS